MSTLRSSIIRLAFEQTQFRSLLLPLLRTATLGFSRRKMMVVDNGGGDEEFSVDAYVLNSGNWAIHRGVTHGKPVGFFRLVHVPTMRTLKSFQGLGEAKNFLGEILSLSPELEFATTEGEVQDLVRDHSYLFRR